MKEKYFSIGCITIFVLASAFGAITLFQDCKAGKFSSPEHFQTGCYIVDAHYSNHDHSLESREIGIVTIDNRNRFHQLELLRDRNQYGYDKTLIDKSRIETVEYFDWGFDIYLAKTGDLDNTVYDDGRYTLFVLGVSLDLCDFEYRDDPR